MIGRDKALGSAKMALLDNRLTQGRAFAWVTIPPNSVCCSRVCRRRGDGSVRPGPRQFGRGCDSAQGLRRAASVERDVGGVPVGRPRPVEGRPFPSGVVSAAPAEARRLDRDAGSANRHPPAGRHPVRRRLAPHRPLDRRGCDLTRPDRFASLPHGSADPRRRSPRIRQCRRGAPKMPISQQENTPIGSQAPHFRRMSLPATAFEPPLPTFVNNPG